MLFVSNETLVNVTTAKSIIFISNLILGNVTIAKSMP